MLRHRNGSARIGRLVLCGALLLAAIGPARVARAEARPSAGGGETCRVTGRIDSREYGAMGGAVERAIVEVVTAGDGTRVRLESFKGNGFSLDLPPGAYELRYSAVGSRGATFEFEKAPLTIEPGCSEVNLGEINLPPNTTTRLYGRPAPEWDGAVAWKNTAPLTLAGLRGKVVVIDFWAHYCSICHAHKPDLVRLAEKYGGRDLAAVTMHDSSLATFEEVDEKMRPIVQRLWKGQPLTLPTALDGRGDDSIFLAYGIRGVPAVILIDPEGRVVRRFHHAGDPELENEVIRLLGQAAGANDPPVEVPAADAPPRPRRPEPPGRRGQPVVFPDELSGRWLLSMPAGFKHNVTWTARDDGTYVLEPGSLSFAGAYERVGNRLVRVPTGGADPAGGRGGVKTYQWDVRKGQQPGLVRIVLTDEPDDSGGNYLGATMDGPIAPGADWGPAAGGVRCMVEAFGREPAYEDAGRVWVLCRTKNTGKGPARVTDVAGKDASPLWAYRLSVTGPDGKTVPLTRQARKATGGPARKRGVRAAELAAGAETTAVFRLADVFDLRRPGRYQVWFSRDVLTDGGGRGGAAPEQATSNVLSFTVGKVAAGNHGLARAPAGRKGPAPPRPAGNAKPPPQAPAGGDETLRYLLSTSELVVTGEITSKPAAQPRQSADDAYTTYACAVRLSDVLKGDRPASQDITVHVARLEALQGDRLPYVQKGQKVILFLKPEPAGPRQPDRHADRDADRDAAWVTSDVWLGVQPFNSVMARSLKRLAGGGNHPPAAPADVGVGIGRQ